MTVIRSRTVHWIAVALCLSGLFGFVLAATVIFSLINIYIPKKSTDLVLLIHACESSFTSMTSQDTGIGPKFVAVTDFNKDGDLDLAIANYDEGSISILLGSGHGGFDLHRKLFNGQSTGPHGIAIGDINNDGNMDLAVANSNASNVGIYFGQGNGKFSSKITYSTGINSVPLGIALGDVNNDKLLDLVVSDNATSALIVFIGNGNGTFNAIGTYSTGVNSGPYSIVINDLNRDHHLDLVVTNSGTNNIGIFLGNGQGNFASQETFSVGLGPKTLVIANFNDDKILDIATANYLGNSVSVLLGNGDGTFAAQKVFSTGNASFPYSINIGDFNRDGKLDLVVANSRTNNIGILTGFGNGAFRQDKVYSTGKNSYPNDVGVGDFNGDNRLDIASVNYNDDNVGIFQNICT